MKIHINADIDASDIDYRGVLEVVEFFCENFDDIEEQAGLRNYRNEFNKVCKKLLIKLNRKEG